MKVIRQIIRVVYLDGTTEEYYYYNMWGTFILHLRHFANMWIEENNEVKIISDRDGSLVQLIDPVTEYLRYLGISHFEWEGTYNG